MNNATTGLFEAVKMNNIEAVKKEERDTTLHETAKHENTEIAKFLVESGAKNYDEPLHETAKHENTEIAKFLVESGAKNYDEPLHETAKHENTEIASPLVEKGAPVDVKDI